jgi:3-phenylpropionate/trans-cinnamate dioxygenase ferredoxin reductase component
MMAENFVIVGAGQAGGWAATTLRTQGFPGTITVVGEEPHPPYERPPLSKDVLLGSKPPESTYLWPGDKVSELKIDLYTGVRVSHLHRDTQELELATGKRLRYEQLLLATGSRVRRLNFPGCDLAGVHYLRTIEDALAIQRDLAPEARLLVLGGGWIGLETTASARKRGAHVTIIEAADQLCSRALPKSLADYLLERHRAQGVNVHLGTTVMALQGAEWVVSARLSTGQELPVSVVVIGVGVEPNVELAQQAGLEVNNGIVVDQSGQTSDRRIFAAGDVTNQPNDFLGRRVRLESWANAQNQGIAVAKAMLGQPVAYHDIPWFWSDQYNLNIQLLGIPHKSDESVTRGDPAADKFLQFFLYGGRIEAAAAVNNPRDLRMAKRLLQSGKEVDRVRLADPGVALQSLA